jgi:hypothetical protein
MHSRKSRRALDLDLRTNSLESRQLLATPTVAIYCRSTNLTKTALYLGAQQYVVWPISQLSATVTLTKPLTVLQATEWTFTTNTKSTAPSTPVSFVAGSKHTYAAKTKVTFQYGPGEVHFLKLIEARYAAPTKPQ